MNGETQQAGIYEGTAGYTVDQVNNNALIIQNVYLCKFFHILYSNSNFLILTKVLDCKQCIFIMMHPYFVSQQQVD